MTTIKLNEQEYNLEQLIRIHSSGVYQRMSADVKLIDVEDAAVVATIDDYIAVASKAGLKVLVRPTSPSQKSGIYILSKYLLKKCLLSVRYENTPLVQDRLTRPTFSSGRRTSPGGRDRSFGSRPLVGSNERVSRQSSDNVRSSNNYPRTS